eukprot:2561785-Rhodomonas_salina.1
METQNNQGQTQTQTQTQTDRQKQTQTLPQTQTERETFRHRYSHATPLSPVRCPPAQCGIHSCCAREIKRKHPKPQYSLY